MSRHKPNEPTKEGPLSFVLLESPFTPVSSVSRGHPFLFNAHHTRLVGSDNTFWSGVEKGRVGARRDNRGGGGERGVKGIRR